MSNKRQKSQSDRLRWRKESLARIQLIEPGDLVGMFGLLASTLSERRRDSELEVLRTERFHANNQSMLHHHSEQLENYNRRLEIASGILKMISTLRCDTEFRQTLISWCESASIED